jgi:glycosyltransferase involved in cell wall biosynthesis
MSGSDGDVTAQDPQQTVVGMAEAMKTLAGSHELRGRMGKAGRERVIQEFSWSRKAEKMSAHYDIVMREQTAFYRTRGYN